MTHVRLPKALCAAVAEVLVGPSHPTLNAMFEAAGAPGPPPDLPHDTKWKTWLHRASNDPAVDSLALVGSLIEEFMDLPPRPVNGLGTFAAVGRFQDPITVWQARRDRLVQVLNEHGFEYFRGGRVFPTGMASQVPSPKGPVAAPSSEVQKPSTLDELLETLVRGLPRAMYPFTNRRKGATTLSFDVESDIQDLLHSQLRPWIADIRPEEFSPSYAGSSTRMDFLLPRYKLVLETKRVRDKAHAKKIGDELILDISHYRCHPGCERLWCVVYDPANMIQNPAGLFELEGSHSKNDGTVQVRVFIFGA